MTELFLEFDNNSGEKNRLRVSGDRCIVGRHSGSDICIPDGRLSRRHLQIDRFGDVFVISDAGSSNGTILNGTRVTDSIALKNGDVVELGGLLVTAVLESEEPANDLQASPEPDASADAAFAAGTPPETVGNSVGVGTRQQPGDGSGSILLWILIPVFGIIFILFAGLIVFVVVSGPTTTVAKKQNDAPYSDDDLDTENDNEKRSNKAESSNSGSSKSPGNSGTNVSTTSDTPSGENNSQSGKPSETAKIEQNGGTFLRNIAHNNPNAFLTTEQATKISSKIKQFSSNSALAANFASAKKSASEIKSLAQSKNLKPQFLAVAAIAKLGSSKGDVFQTAKGMADVLSKLGVSVGNERADDTLIVIAIYEQGVAGDFLKMRNMLQDLANKSPESSRAIRTIWFLQKNGKISQAEFENALNFLAIGTISQNPKDFGINAEALVL